MAQMTPLRDEVQVFAQAMERELRRNEHKGVWGNEEFDYLLSRLEDEVKELREAVFKLQNVPVEARPQAAAKVLQESADVGNFAMMIADNADAL